MEDREAITELTAKVQLLADWQALVNPPITRLIHDQAYRDRRAEDRDKQWRRVGVRVAVTASLVGVVSGLVVVGERIVQGVHLLGL